VLAMTLTAVDAWSFSSFFSKDSGKAEPHERLGSPKHFADTIVKEIKDTKKPENRDGDQAPGNIEKLTTVKSSLEVLIKILKGWDPRAAVIPFDPSWPADFKRRLNNSRVMKPDWPKDELNTLEDKLEKTIRRIGMPKSTDAAKRESRWRARYKRLQSELIQMNTIMRGWKPEAPSNTIPIDRSWPQSLYERLQVCATMGPKERKVILGENEKKLSKIKAWLEFRSATGAPPA